MSCSNRILRTMLMRRWRWLIGAALILNILIMMYLVQQPLSSSTYSHQTQGHNLQQDGHSPETFANSVTVILRDFENFDNAIVDTIKELQSVLPGVKVLVIGDTQPYPPLHVDKTWNTDIVSLQVNLLHNYSSSRPDHLIKTKFVLLLPDGVRLKHWRNLQTAANHLGGKGRTKAVAVGVGQQPLQCLSLDVDLKRWQVTFTTHNASSDYCDKLDGDHALLLQTADFRSLADPFARPLRHCFYLQAKLRQWKIRYLKRLQLVRIKELFEDPHSKWKHKRSEEERVSQFYKLSGIKRVINTNGLSSYYGCTKTTARCFGTIVDDMPEYLYQGKWTPPCCLRALRETAKYVFSILEQENVRYWLEGGSLLGAARNEDIIPWDYDVDIGIYKDDIEKSSYLKDASQSSFIDDQGFVWEKATEGDFFRVQYSEQNHLHVDIHPFYSENGIMTKNTWLKTHRQDTEFPEKFLQPLTRIKFAGILASAPNNVKDFLEYKFGVDVISQPRFPNFQKVQ